MHPVVRRWWIAPLAAVAGLLGACSHPDAVVGPTLTPRAPARALVPLSSSAGVVISQVYGGGGNSGATYKNDFIELYNGGTNDVDLSSASVQYASANGTSWQVTNLTGTIPAGHYYLVKEAAGTGGTTDLPTPDATGAGTGIPMAAGAGKVALVLNQTALAGTVAGTAPLGGSPCPTAAATASIVDFVGYGTGTSGATCFEGSAPAPTLSNTNAGLRKSNGAQDTNNNGTDFQTGAPNPRNSGQSAVAGPLDHVTVSGPSSVAVNGTITLTANLQDAGNLAINDPSATYAWTLLDPSTAQIVSTSGNTATVKGVQTGGPVTISVSATSNGVTKNGSAQVSVTPPASNVSVSSRAVPLPVGFQTQLFASGTDFGGNPVTNPTWSTSNPNVLTVDQSGVITATGVGSAIITATAADGAAGSTTVSTESQLFSSTARAGHNTEFGTPTDADASNDVIIARKQYTISYNPQRGGPNWVSWDLSATHLGAADRCNCFTADTALTRLGLPAYTTADYITGGQYDRGHMEPSADQTTTDTENGATFFLTNVLPQRHDLNAGPWEKLEIALRDTARAGREVYVIAGGVFTNGVGLGSLNNAGKIFIPDSTWKIVVTVPAGTGLDQVTSTTDLNVFAVNMPNVTGIISQGWEQYKTTVQKIQQSTGYDFLAALPEAIECKVEVRDCLPEVQLSTPTPDAAAGGTFNVQVRFRDADASDAPWKIVINWGDGSTPSTTSSFVQTWTTPLTRGHVYAAAGSYTITVTITDKQGGVTTTQLPLTIH